MTLVTANNQPVLELTLTLPFVGAWHALLEVDTDDAISGAVELRCDDTVFTGTALGAPSVVGGVCRAEIIGGAGGLRSIVEARSYRGITARSVIAELLASVGERLSSGSSASLLGTRLAFWTRARGYAGAALASVVDALGETARWRVLADGSVWVGVDSWPPASDAAQGLELDRDGAAGAVLIAPDVPALTPGVAFGSEHVGRVEHRVTREESLRTLYWIAA